MQADIATTHPDRPSMLPTCGPKPAKPARASKPDQAQPSPAKAQPSPAKPNQAQPKPSPSPAEAQPKPNQAQPAKQLTRCQKRRVEAKAQLPSHSLRPQDNTHTRADTQQDKTSHTSGLSSKLETANKPSQSKRSGGAHVKKHYNGRWGPNFFI